MIKQDLQLLDELISDIKRQTIEKGYHKFEILSHYVPENCEV